MRRASLIASVIMILLSIGIFLEASTFKKAEAAIAEGPGFYPQLLASTLAILSLLIIYNTLRKKDDVKLMFFNKRVVYGTIIIIAYCIIFNFLGFALSSIIAMAFLVKIMGGTSWKTIIISSTVIPVGIYLVFNNLLQVPLPWGIFENFL